MKKTGHVRGVRDLGAVLILLAAGLLVAGTAYTASAQTYTVIHSFTGGTDGAIPRTGLTADASGNYYGTTTYGGYQGQNCGATGCGTVFKLAKRNGSWMLTNLYSFKGGSDSAWPTARVVFGPDGALYGTTAGGNGSSCSNNGCGSVFRLSPPPTVCAAVSCPWKETILHQFSGFDGQVPGSGDLIFDHDGSIYGTTIAGGSGLWGTVYKLTHSNGQWTESVLYNFTGQGDGGDPIGGVISDGAGDLYGTTALGGLNSLPDFYGPGVVYELTPSGSGWTENTLYMFTDSSGDGGLPAASLVVGRDGTMYGTSPAGGIGLCAYYTYYTGCGTVFAVAQHYASTIFYNFPNDAINPGLSGPSAPVTIDSSRNIYGTTLADGQHNAGSVFEIIFPNWTYNSLHDFTGNSDGGYPSSNVVIDGSGNLFGTATAGGNSNTCTMQGGCGVIWEITR